MAAAAATTAATAAANDDVEAWVEVEDKGSGKHYFVNKITKQTTWTRPAVLSTPLPAGWLPVKDSSTGKIYYANKETKATSWTRPKPPAEPAPPPAHADDDDDDDGGGGDTTSEDEDALEPAAARPSSNEAKTAAVRESTAERMLRLKQEAHQRAQEELPESSDSDSDDDVTSFEFAEHRHGFVSRLFRVGKVFDAKRLLSFKKSMIHKALLQKNQHLNAHCEQSFKNIMSYMGDRESSKKDDNAHARKLLRNAIEHPGGMRDEIYLQLVKQTTENPRIESTLKGWELMLYCLATFPPSKRLQKFLKSYFRSEQHPDLARMVEDASERLQRIVKCGPRLEIPTVDELACIKAHRSMVIKVYLLEGGHKSVQVDAYQTVRDIEELMLHKLGIELGSLFALYETDLSQPNVEQILEPGQRVVDIIAAWAHEPEVEEFKKRDGKAKGKTAASDPETGTLVVQRPRFNALLFKAKLVLKTKDPDVMADKEAINLLFLQAVHDVNTERYPSQKEDIEVLAALQLQAQFGDFQADTHETGWLGPMLAQYMPKSLISGKNAEKKVLEWEQKIIEKYRRISGFTPLESKLNYLDYVEEWPFYGATFVIVEQKQFKDYPSPLVLGITCEGIVLMEPGTRKMLESYPYVDIVTWGHSDDRFIVVVGNVVQQRKLIFKTKRGKNMNNLVHDFVRFKVKVRAAETGAIIDRAHEALGGGP